MKSLTVVNTLGLFVIMALVAFRTSTWHGQHSKTKLNDQEMAFVYGGECTDYEWWAYGYYDDKCNRYNELDACAKAEELYRKCYGYTLGDPNAPPYTPGSGPAPTPCDPCPNGGSEEEYSTCQQIGGQILGTSACWNGIGPTRVCCQ